MGSKTKSSPPSFVDFEPYCEWQKDVGFETLIIHLHDFKKEQLRVQVINQRLLRVSGEREIEKTKTKRFVKETIIPEGCTNLNDIKAKFTKTCLHITMPRNPNPDDHEEGKMGLFAPKSPNKDDNESTRKPKSDDHEGKMGREVGGVGSSLGKRLQESKKMAMYFGISVVVMVAVGAFVAYKCDSHPSCSYYDLELGLN